VHSENPQRIYIAAWERVYFFIVLCILYIVRVDWSRGWHVYLSTKAPFTRYNLLSNRLSNRFNNRVNVLYTIQPVVKAVVQPGLTTGCIV